MISKTSGYIKNRLKNAKNTGVRQTAKRVLLGGNEKMGILPKSVIYILLTVIAYVYLYPLLYMLATSFKSLGDLIDSSVKWIPSKMYPDNYRQALSVMHFKDTLFNTLLLTLVPALLQVVTASLAGYAFASYRFRGRGLLMAALIFTFVLPKQATMMPTFLLFKELDIIGTAKAAILPAVLGQGFNSTIITLIFYQFYSQIPVSFVEAAKLDGCGHIKVFYKIALPMVKAAFIIGFLFSFVWYWNETYFTNLFVAGTGLGNKETISTLLIELSRFEASYQLLYPEAGSVSRINESIVMAGTMLCIAPLLLLYFAMQRYFVQSVDMVGLKE